MQTIKFKRATRAQIDAAATAGSLNLGEPYAITDEGRLAIGESATAYTAFLKDGEGGGAASGEVATPTNTSPADNAIDVAPPLVITASAFSSTGAAPHATARYQLSTINNFALPDYDSGEVAAVASYTIEPGIVGFGESVYWRIQFKDALGIWSDWSAPTQFEARGVSVVTKPTNTLPADGAIGTKRSQSLTASAFVSTQGAAHQATRLQISSSTSFTAPRIDVTLGAVAEYRIPKADFAYEATEYWRMQYQNSLGIWSNWSDATGYTTGMAGDYIDTPAPTPENFGDAFEGGFYTGMIWNQIAQSADSKTLAIGEQTFTVPDMNITPIVHEEGHQLEIRSRANPENHFKCVVTDALGTALIVNVTAISGSGTFSDWSVMSRFRVLTANKAAGEFTAALKSTATAMPAACRSLCEGWLSTLAMVGDGASSVYPAAHAARALVIGGYSDFYIPSRDEAELQYRNLKPLTVNNHTPARSKTAYNINRDGAYGDVSTSCGVNLNSYPAGLAYSASDPAMTAATVFQSGGVQALESAGTYYWTSTENGTRNTWYQCYISGRYGEQHAENRTIPIKIRAVRRSII